MPILQDAINRAPVVVTRPDGTTVTGRLVALGGDRRVGVGRCKVRLASGAFLSPRIEWVEIIDEGKAPS